MASSKEILPAASRYAAALADSALKRKTLLPQADCRFEAELSEKIGALVSAAYEKTLRLEGYLAAPPKGDSLQLAIFYRDQVLSSMEVLRGDLDELERLTAGDYWPLPDYGEILFSVSD